MERVRFGGRFTQALTVFSVLAFAACDGGIDVDPGGDGRVVEVVIEGLDDALTALGQSRMLTARALDAQGETVSNVSFTWSVDGDGIVTLTAGGELTALANGVDRVRVTVDGVEGTAQVVVRQEAASLTVTNSPPGTFSYAGETNRILVSAVDSRDNPVTDNTSFTWTSSDPDILYVDPVGQVTAISQGQATISVSSGELTESFVLTVSLNGPLGPALLGGGYTCEDGRAGGFDCSNIDLLAYLPVSALGTPSTFVQVTDMWGWTDPQTGIEYAIVERSDGTVFLDMSDPTRPRLRGFLAYPSGSPANVWHDVKVYQNHAFIVSDASGEGHGMQVFDLTKLRSDDPRPLGFSMDAHYTEFGSAHNIAINEDTGYAYILGANSGGETCGGGLHMVDINDPVNPVFAGCYNDPLTGWGSSGYVHDAQCVTYAGPDADYSGREICIGSNENSIHVADVTDKTNPFTISVASYPNVRYAHQGWFTDDFRYLYTNDELDEGRALTMFTRTLVWDMEDLDDPILVDEHLGPNRAIDHNLFVVGDRLYQSNYAFGIRVLDISNPGDPVDIGYFDTSPNDVNQPYFGGSWSNYPFFESGILVVTSMEEGLFVLRVRD